MTEYSAVGRNNESPVKSPRTPYDPSSVDMAFKQPLVFPSQETNKIRIIHTTGVKLHFRQCITKLTPGGSYHPVLIVYTV